MKIQGLVSSSKKGLIAILILALVLMPVIGNTSCTPGEWLYLLVYSAVCGIQVYVDGEYQGRLEFAKKWGYCMLEVVTTEGMHELQFVVPGPVVAASSPSAETALRAGKVPDIKVSYEGPLVDGGYYEVSFGQESASQERQLAQTAEGSYDNTIIVEASKEPFKPPPAPTQTYSLNVAVTPSVGGSVSPPGGEYDAGTQVTLTATPAGGYSFDYWNGSASGSSPTTTVTMNSNKSVTAHFEEIPSQPKYYTLTTEVSGSGSISPSGGDYEEGTSVTLTASPGSGWTFDHWGGNASGSSSSTSVTINSNKHVIAYFARKAPSPTADTTPPTISNVSASTTETSATITWTTDELASSQVEYGTTSAYGSSSPATPANDPSSGTSIGVTSHSVQLTGLEPGTQYHYRVRSKDASGNEAVSSVKAFTTMLAGPADFRLADLTIVPKRSVKEGQTVSISAVVTNNGGSKGSYTLVLKINNEVEGTEHIADLAAGGSQTVTFAVTKDVAGDYIIDLNGLADYFIVKGGPSFEATEYKNADYGFSVKYPAKWAEQEATGTTVFYGAAPAGVPVMFVCVAEGATFADAVIAALKAMGAVGTSVESESETALADGTPATEAILKTTLKGYGASALSVGAEKDGKWVIVIVGTVELLAKFDEALFSEIGHTLQFE